MNTLSIFKLGSKAYYEEVPHYKNPYVDIPLDGVDNSAHSIWLEGWHSAEKEHNLFTENQELKGHISELSLANVDEVIALKKSAKKMISLISRDSQSIINYRDFVNKRDDQLNALIDKVEKLNKFTFSREKMVKAIKSILNRVHSHLEVKAPEVEKKKTK